MKKQKIYAIYKGDNTEFAIIGEKYNFDIELGSNYLFKVVNTTNNKQAFYSFAKLFQHFHNITPMSKPIAKTSIEVLKAMYEGNGKEFLKQYIDNVKVITDKAGDDYLTKVLGIDRNG